MEAQRVSSSMHTHLDYSQKLKELEKNQSTLDQFVKVAPREQLSSLNRKIIHFIACNNQPFSIVEEPTFKCLFLQSDREALKQRRHYSDWILPKVYAMVKRKVQAQLDDCPSFSFTSDIWTGPTESFISLTAHGICSSWNRLKFTLCVRHFTGHHNYVTTAEKVRAMLAEWRIPREKWHVFLRDEGANMKKAFEEGGFSLADCGAYKLNLVVNKSIFGDEEIKSLLDGCGKLVSRKLEQLEEIVEMLDPFEQASRQMCHDSSPISIQFPMAVILQKKVDSINHPLLKECELYQMLSGQMYATRFKRIL